MPTPSTPPDPDTPHVATSGDLPDDLAPPDDFGAVVLDVFERRAADAEHPTDDAGAPPGGWPDKSASSDVDVSTTPAPASGDAPDPSDDLSDEGEGSASADASSVSQDAPVGGPDGAEEPPSGADEPDPPDPVDETTPPAAPAGYTWQVDGGDPISFTDDQIQQAIGLAAWAEQLPDQTRAQFSAIEQGQAVAIPRADFDQFQAWREQQSRTTRDADLSEIADTDPDVAKLIAGLRDEVAQLRGGTPAADPGVTQDQAPAPGAVNATIQHNIDQTAAQFDAATKAYGETRGLSPDELDALMNDAVNAQIIPSLMQTNSTFNPATGALLQPADIATVTEQALDFALVRNPALHSRVLGGTESAPGSHAAGTVPPPQPSNPDPVIAKRARAASLASAPSAAVTTPPRTPQNTSPQERVDAMAAEIQAALAAS